MDTGVDFLAVVEHRLIPARVRSEWSRLRRKGLASIWAPASQDSSHVGNAGVGVVSLRGAPLSLPTFATAQFKRFFDCGRAVRCMVPIGFGLVMHLVVLYGFQGADTDAEIYDERLQFMSRHDALLLDDSLDAGDVSRAWVVWSGAVESALADAYRFSGGPLPSRAWFWVGEVLLLGLLSLVVIECGRIVALLLTLLMLLMSFCTVILLLLPFLICGVGSKL